jgi:hypothetical protein
MNNELYIIDIDSRPRYITLDQNAVSKLRNTIFLAGPFDHDQDGYQKAHRAFLEISRRGVYNVR